MRNQKIINGINYLECKKCGEYKHPNDFYNTNRGITGKNSLCRNCIKKGKKYKVDIIKNQEIRKNSILKSELKHSNDLGFSRKKFHRKASDFIKHHKLRPKECSICGTKGRIIFHHINYYSEISWDYGIFCCQSCHDKIHKGKIKKLNPIHLSLLKK